MLVVVIMVLVVISMVLVVFFVVFVVIFVMFMLAQITLVRHGTGTGINKSFFLFRSFIISALDFVAFFHNFLIVRLIAALHFIFISNFSDFGFIFSVIDQFASFTFLTFCIIYNFTCSLVNLSSTMESN